MKNTYKHTERVFERATFFIIAILGNSITFVIASALVIFWLSNKLFQAQDINERIGDIIQGISFLSLLIIQRSFKRFSASLHLKVNELVKSDEHASNAVINMEGKTDREIAKLIHEYRELSEPAPKRNKRYFCI